MKGPRLVYIWTAELFASQELWLVNLECLDLFGWPKSIHLGFLDNRYRKDKVLEQLKNFWVGFNDIFDCCKSHELP